MRKIYKVGPLFLCLFYLLGCDSKGSTTDTNLTNNNTDVQEGDKTNTNTNNDNNGVNNNDNNNTNNSNDNNGANNNTNDITDDKPMELSNNNGMVVKFANKGAKIDSIEYDGIKIGENGFVAGRVANRIANATFTLDGVTYNVDKNNGKHCLHGGSKGFGEVDWTKTYEDDNKIVFELDSPDGDQGFPGNIHVTTTYTLSNDGELNIEFGAHSDKTTIFNPTNHLYLNLNGVETKTWKNHELWLSSKKYTKTNNELIPTGDIVSTEGTNLDYYHVKKEYVGNLDSNIVFRDFKSKYVGKAAELTGAKTGITCEVMTNRPGLQIYNDNGHICLEAQDFPDAINHSTFPSIVLNANEEYSSKTTYKFTREKMQTTNANLVHRPVNNRVNLGLDTDFVSNTSSRLLEKIAPLLSDGNVEDYVISPASLLLCYAGLSAVSSNFNDEEFGLTNTEEEVKKLLEAWNFECEDSCFKSTVLHQQIGTNFKFDDNKRQSIADKYISTMVSSIDSYNEDAANFFKNEMGMQITPPEFDVPKDKGGVATYGAFKMKDYAPFGLTCENKSFNFKTGKEEVMSYVFDREEWPDNHQYYKGSNYCIFDVDIATTDLLIVLPDEDININEVNITEAYQKFISESKRVRGYGYVPLFHNKTSDIDLTDIFKTAVDGDEIIMDKLLRDDVLENPFNRLEIIEAFQTSDFELNKYGVAGESITGVLVGATAAPSGNEIVDLTVDRPFYAISRYYNFPLFVNKVVNPGK